MWRYDKDHRERILPALRDYEDKLAMINKGYYFAYGRDHSERPIVYFDARKWLDTKIDIHDMFKTVDITLSYLIYNALIPGKIENYHVIIDMENIGLTEFPVNWVRMIALHVRDGYFARCASLSFVNVPYLVKALSKIIFAIVDDFQGSKMYVFKQDFNPKLKKSLGFENIEKSYGGYLPKKTSDYFPPRLSERRENPKKKKKAAK